MGWSTSMSKQRSCNRVSERFTPLVDDATDGAGRPLPRQLPAAPKPWIPLTPEQRTALHERTEHVRDLLPTPLVGAEGLVEQSPLVGRGWSLAGSRKCHPHLEAAART
jgi:hypothetical protein